MYRSGFLVFLDNLWESGCMLGRVLAISGSVACVVLLIVLQVTTPSTIGSLGLLFVFILMYVIALSALTFLLYSANRTIRRLTSTLVTRRPVGELNLQRSYYYASILALGPVMLIAMQSVGMVSIYDVLLIAAFIGLACFYVAKRSA